MRLKQNKKLVDSEVEEAEDLIKDIRAERIQQKWIKESTGKTGSTDPEKEDKVVDESWEEKRDVWSPETPHAVLNLGTHRLLLTIQFQLQWHLQIFLMKALKRLNCLQY